MSNQGHPHTRFLKLLFPLVFWLILLRQWIGEVKIRWPHLTYGSPVDVFLLYFFIYFSWPCFLLISWKNHYLHERQFQSRDHYETYYQEVVKYLEHRFINISSSSYYNNTMNRKSKFIGYHFWKRVGQLVYN